MIRLLTTAVVLGLFSSAAHAADRLPLPDGSYASKAKFCKMGKDRAYQEYEFAFYDIQGNQVSNYETSCAIRDVSVKGKTISFKQVCEDEGESTVSRNVWTKLGPTKFADSNGRVWTGCGRFVE
jgi:hypothetical protein